MDNNPSSETSSRPVWSFYTPDTSLPALDTRLLSSNDPPTSADEFTLRSQLINLRRTFSEAEARMDMDAIRSAIHDIEIVLHPVRSLPQDILATIFERCMTLPDDVVVVCAVYDSLGPKNPIWTLSSVCRRWRDIILASPRMWSFICINMFEYLENPGGLAYTPSRLGLQIQRSGNVEMDVALFNPPKRGDHYPSSLVLPLCLLPLLCPTTQRWRSFRIRGLYSTFDSFMGCSFEKLTRLTISRDSEANSGDRIITCFRHAPHIQHFGTNFGNVELLWDGIASYDCDNTGLANIPKIAASLRRLTVSCGVSADRWRPAAPLVLPMLTRLHIVASSPIPIQSSPIDMLETPVLHTLCLIYRHSIRVLFPHFRRSLTCLKNIAVIEASRIRVAEFITFLEGLAGVTALFLDNSGATAEVLATLRPGTAETLLLLPELKSLRLEPGTIKRCCDAVIELVDSRPGIEELWVVGDLDKDWREGERDPGEADRWRAFCSRTRVIHVLENDF